MLIGYFIMLQMFNITYRRSLNQEAETILNAVAGSFDSAFQIFMMGSASWQRKKSFAKIWKMEMEQEPPYTGSCTQSAPNTVSTLIFPFMM